MTMATAPRDVLSRDEAQRRSEVVSAVEYELHLDLQAGADRYHGEVVIRFSFSGTQGIFLDHRGDVIETFEVNGTAVEPQSNGYRIKLPAAILEPRNEIRIVFEHTFDHAGDGFHRFVDPEDGGEYLYTNFEPYAAHRLFPCFDQPDIKATYDLVVDAPTTWTIIANATRTTERDLGDERTRRTFARTAPFSTYLFAVVAGPYASFGDVHHGMPIGLYCRRSLASLIEADEIFEITKQGLDFYAEYFDHPYPFGKYDQVFAPEFNIGAMENVGVVIHADRLIFREPPTENDRLSRADIILHEMAHMWFGNLVTMRWWNDLWLNESFATYIAAVATAEATRFGDNAWLAFNAGMKTWAYRQDQLVTTHPIAGEVPDTDATFLNFDGITYGKGAAVLQQLVATVGPHEFRQAMRGYFHKHAFGNATLGDLLDAVATQTQQDIPAWSRAWIETAGLNTIAARADTDNGALQSLTLTQTAPDDLPVLRPHAIEVALVHDTPDGVVIESIPAEISDAEVRFDAIGPLPAPAMIIPNHRDLTYAALLLDDESAAWALAHMNTIPAPLLRQICWQAFWNMTRTHRLPAGEYLAAAYRHLPGEQTLPIVRFVLGTTAVAIDRFVHEPIAATERHRLFKTAWTCANDPDDTPATRDLRLTWLRAAISTAIGRDDLATVLHAIDQEHIIGDIAIDQDMRWAAAVLAAAAGMDNDGARRDGEADRDQSDRGQRRLLQARASVPLAATKEEVWERANGNGYGSLHLTEAAMSGFHWASQHDLLTPWTEPFFEAASDIFAEREHAFASARFAGLFPWSQISADTLRRSEALVGNARDSSQVLVRNLREANDDLARALRAREYDAAARGIVAAVPAAS